MATTTGSVPEGKSSVPVCDARTLRAIAEADFDAPGVHEEFGCNHCNPLDQDLIEYFPAKTSLSPDGDEEVLLVREPETHEQAAVRHEIENAFPVKESLAGSILKFEHWQVDFLRSRNVSDEFLRFLRNFHAGVRA